MIRAEDPSGLQPARFGDSDKAKAGDVVLAVGNPLGLPSSVTEGIISATGRAVTVRPAVARIHSIPARAEDLLRWRDVGHPAPAPAWPLS